MRSKPKTTYRGLQPIGGLLTPSSDGALGTVAGLLHARRHLMPLLPPSVQSHVRFQNIDRGTLTILIDHPAWRMQLQPLEGMFRQTLEMKDLRFRYRVVRLKQNTSVVNQRQQAPTLKEKEGPYTTGDESIAGKIARWRRSLARLNKGGKS